MAAASAAGATNIKVASVADFAAGQSIIIDTGSNLETAAITTVGTAGATTVGAATAAGATVIPVASGTGFSVSQTITIDSGTNRGGRCRLHRQRGGATDHRRRADYYCARGGRTGVRQRHHPRHCVDPAA
jgi:hypothetical protein